MTSTPNMESCFCLYCNGQKEPLPITSLCFYGTWSLFLNEDTSRNRFQLNMSWTDGQSWKLKGRSYLAWVLLFEKQKIPYENGPTNPDFSYMVAELGDAEQTRVHKAPTTGERRGSCERRLFRVPYLLCRKPMLPGWEQLVPGALDVKCVFLLGLPGWNLNLGTRKTNLFWQLHPMSKWLNPHV